MSEGNRNPELFDPDDDNRYDDEDLDQLTTAELRKIDELAAAITEALMNDLTYAEWVDERHRETIEDQDKVN